MKCQNIFSGKKENVINLSSAESAQRVVKINKTVKTQQENHKKVLKEQMKLIEVLQCLSRVTRTGIPTHRTKPYSQMR